MWIVRLALRRPYTFIVMALLIAVLGVAAIVTMTVDIFPSINIPVVTVIWNYSGLSPTEMQDRIVTTSERAFTTTVNGIEHIESVSLRGTAVTRLYFRSNVPIEAAIAQVNAQAQQIDRDLVGAVPGRAAGPYRPDVWAGVHRRGERNRAHRIRVAPWHGRHAALLPFQRADRGGHRPGECPGAADRADPAAGYLSAAHHPVQRRQRSRPPGELEQRSAAGTGAQRPGQQLHPHPARHRPGRIHPGALWRQGARGERRHRSRRSLRAGAVTTGRLQCDPHSECHPPCRHAEDRDARI